MTRVAGIRNVHLPQGPRSRPKGRAGLWDLSLDARGRIDRIGRRLRFGGHGRALDGRGGLILPSLVDPHLHLDLAYSIDLVEPNVSGTLLEAIRHWDQAKRKLSAENVRERAIRAVRAEVGFGTGFIRTHVDVGTGAGLRLVEGVLAAREKCADLCEIQVVAFPQDGLLKDPGAYEQMGEAMRMGCDVVGGIAHNERTADDSKRHIEMIFDLAEEFDADIDCHIDETDDPESRCTEHLAARTIERGRQERVTASHVCALSSYDHAHARKVMDLLAEARVHVVANPGVNLHLQGRHDRYPKRRGLTRVTELLGAGVNVAAGQDCIADPFYPFGTGQMLEVAHLLCHAEHLTRPPQIVEAVAAVTTRAAKALRLSGYGLAVGCHGNVTILPVPSESEAVRVRPRPSHVLKSGRLLRVP